MDAVEAGIQVLTQGPTEGIQDDVSATVHSDLGS